MASWQTSIVGIVLILIGGVGIKWGGIDPLIGGAIITAGLGFLRTKDAQVTGGSVPQASPPGVAIKSDALGVIDAVNAMPIETLGASIAMANAVKVITTPVSPADVKLCK